MYIRATRVHTPPEKIQDAIRNFESNVVKRVRSAQGNQGAILLVNRQTGDGMGITYWESAKALGASEQLGIDSRSQAAQNVPGAQIVNVERAEVVIMERSGPPKAGTFVRLVSGAADPQKLDAAVGVLRKNLPTIKGLKGFRAAVAAIDRQTGRTFVSSVWDTRQDLDASDSAISGFRQEAAKAGGVNPDTLKVEIFESAVVEFSPELAAQTARA